MKLCYNVYIYLCYLHQFKACRNLALYDMPVDRTNVQKWYVVHVNTGNANDDKRELEKVGLTPFKP